MSNPPRRSRPRKPAETIDLTAERIETGPIVPQTDDAPGRGDETGASADPEARIGEEASPAPDPAPGEGAVAQPEGIAVLGEPEPGDRNAPPAADGTVAADAQGDIPAETTGDARTGEPAADRPAAEPTAEEAFASEEGLRRERREDGHRHEELDAETILAAAEPQPAEPPRPDLNYHETPSRHADMHGAGLGAVVGAALLGAALALLAGGALQYAGVVPAVSAQDPALLAQQFARTGDVQQLTTDLNTLRNDVGELKSTLSAGGAGGTGPTGADFAALSDRFNGLEGRLNAVASGGAQPAADPNALAGIAAAADEARGTAGEARQAAEGAAARADEARQTAATAAQAAGTAQQAADVAQTAAKGAMEAADANRQAIAEIQGRIGSVEQANRQAAVAISAANLKASVDRGGPFMTELEAYAKAAGPSPAVDSLRNYAAAGVPTAASLQDGWPDVRSAILKAVRPQDPNAGIGTQILSGLSGLVAVRPSGSAASSGAAGPDATVARLDALLSAGDLDGWNAEWQKLPQPAKDAGADFQRQVDARRAAEKVVGEALGQAVNSIGNAG